VGSAADITGGSDDSQARGVDESIAALAGARTGGLAVEISVNATGTRPGSGPDKRELFSEETGTVLVFPDGAVIRLCAAVATGQLIFLTNKTRSTEVVCQVVGKRVYRPTSCYVELQFTESMKDFWGITFPESNTAVQAPAAEVESVASAEVTEDGAELHAPLPTAEEVESLREEVEVLRKQLEQVKLAKDSTKTIEAMTRAADVPELAIETTTVPRVANLQIVEERTEVMSANEPAPTFAPTFTPATVVAPTTIPFVPPQVAEAASEQVPPAPWKSFGLADDVATATKNSRPKTLSAPPGDRKPQVAMALPNRDLAPKVDPEQELIDQLLPQPALDFSKAPKHVNGVDPDDPYSIYKPTRAKMEKWVLVLLVMVLVGTVGFGVWKLGLIHNLLRLRTKKPQTMVQGNRTPAGAPAAGTLTPAETGPTNARATEAPASDTGPAATATAQNNVGGVQEKKSANAADFHAAGPSPEAVSQNTGKSGAGTSAVAAKKMNPTTKGAKKKVEAAPPIGTSVEAPIPEDAPVVAAKLLKAVSPIYPPDAMNNFITGDVRLKAEVDERGQVRNIEVISGPAALRPAAIEAMKQYEYAPATKGGRGIVSTVQVTIKFWFNP